MFTDWRKCVKAELIRIYQCLWMCEIRIHQKSMFHVNPFYVDGKVLRTRALSFKSMVMRIGINQTQFIQLKNILDAQYFQFHIYYKNKNLLFISERNLSYYDKKHGIQGISFQYRPRGVYSGQLYMPLSLARAQSKSSSSVGSGDNVDPSSAPPSCHLLHVTP